MIIDLLHRKIRRRFHWYGFTDAFLNTGRFTLHSYERIASGSGKTLMLLHGLGTSSSTWVRILPALDPAWNVLALDLPGFGFSEIHSGTPFARMDELHQAVETFVRDRGLRSFVLLGHSLGGWLAAKFALEHPQALLHLVLSDNAGILCDETLEQGKAFDVHSVKDMNSLLNKIWFRYPWYFKPFYLAVLNDFKRRRIGEFLRSIREDDFLNNRIRTLSVSTTIIWGAQDNLISVKSAQMLKESIPRSEIYLIDNCGHVPQLERPAELVNILRTILR